MAVSFASSKVEIELSNSITFENCRDTWVPIVGTIRLYLLNIYL